MRRLLLEGLARRPLTEKPPAADNAALAELAASLDRAARRRLGRSLAIREVDAGSCNGCELEIHALNNAFYDLERFGLRFVASPRHADVLLVTGPVTKNMREALERTYRATPDPKWVVALGDCAAGRNLRRQLCRGWRRVEGGAGRLAHLRLSAHAGDDSQEIDLALGAGEWTSPLPAARGEVEGAKRPRVRGPHPDPLPARRGEGDAGDLHPVGSTERPVPNSQ